MVAEVLDGINGTVFAYGQTGSGKTYTVSGAADRYVDRGIIPRALAMIYGEIDKRSDWQFDVAVSYLELYNESGYDLLDPNKEVADLEDLPKVQILEDENKDLHFRNLSLRRAQTVEEALNLLFVGEVNRSVSATAMNQASSRSHCLFTVHLEARQQGSDLVRRSKLNLVDLAGSERVGKTGAEGSTLQEAMYINGSLFHLEMVIIALQEKAMGQGSRHIPYRNSMMTMALRDSLGGNCKTVMVATISSEMQQMGESISTCRFAQRVAMISNKVEVNEDLDPKLLIRRLKQEVRDLKDEVRMLRGGDERGPLTGEEQQHVAKMVEAFCKDPDPAAALNLGGSMEFIRGAFHAFKGMVRSLTGGTGDVPERGSVGQAAAGPSKTEPERGEGQGGSDAQPGGAEMVKKLRLQLQERDHEINILVNMLTKRDAAAATKGAEAAPPALARPLAVSSEPAGGGAAHPQAQVPDALIDPAVLADRGRAFELFRKSYRKNEAIEDNKALLKGKYDAAKALAQQVNASKRKVQELRGTFEQMRMRASAAAVTDGIDPTQVPMTEEEDRIRHAIEGEKVVYRDSYEALKGLKHEIEHIQMMLNRSRQQVQRDFEQWLSVMTRQVGMPALTASLGEASSHTQSQQADCGGPALPSAQPPPGVSQHVAQMVQQGRVRTPPGARFAAAGEGAPGPSSRMAVPGNAPGGSTDLTISGSGGPSAVYGGIGVIGGVRSGGGGESWSDAGPVLTGNRDVDEDILRFHDAKKKLQGR